MLTHASEPLGEQVTKIIDLVMLSIGDVRNEFR